MTRQHSVTYHCPNCRTWQTAETLFGRWIRSNPDLDSREGICVVDQDYWIHKFKHHGNRAFQLLMGVEVKLMGAELSRAQRDTLLALNQLMRNRRHSINKSSQQVGNYVPVVSAFDGQERNVRFYGVHVLRFSGLGPDDSEWIKWDLKDIDTPMLTSILRFDLDPDTLRPLDLRNHHPNHFTRSMELWPGSAAS